MAIFRVTDTQGYDVTLDDERWDHILEGHPEIAGLLDLLEETIRDPNLVKRDPQRRAIHYYYRSSERTVLGRENILMSAVVERLEANKVGRVMTAHLVRKPRRDGEVVWFRPQPT